MSLKDILSRSRIDDIIIDAGRSLRATVRQESREAVEAFDTKLDELRASVRREFENARAATSMEEAVLGAAGFTILGLVIGFLIWGM